MACSKLLCKCWKTVKKVLKETTDSEFDYQNSLEKNTVIMYDKKLYDLFINIGHCSFKLLQ